MTRYTSNSSHDDHDRHAALDAELRAVHVALDADADSRRAEPGADFEHRIAIASFGGLMPAASIIASPVVAGRIGPWWFSAKRLAAAIAILAASGAAWLAIKPAPTDQSSTPSIASNHRDSDSRSIAADAADDWIAIATTMDDGTSDEIDSLFADTVRVESNLRSTDSLLGGSVSMDGGGV